jgi:hypothetical protein
MPKKTKDTKNTIENATKNIKKITEKLVEDVSELIKPETKKSTSKSKKSTSKKATSTIETASKKAVPTTKATSKKASSKANKSASTKKEEKKSVTQSASKDKKSTTKSATKENKSTTKSDAKSATKATTTRKKASSSKSPVSKKTNTTKTRKKATTAKMKKSDFTPEYYDLPYRYNQTVVKILAQTPDNLFIYWDISDNDRENLKKQYGEYLFEITKPVLIVHNETLNYSFEVDINDFANSWYLKIDDSDCEYKIELGRRPIPINYSYIPQYDVEKNGPISPIEKPYIYISSSNELVSPNDHILFNKQNKIYFRNVKNNQIIEKDIKDFPFIYKNSEFVNIYEIYKDLYKDELKNNYLDLRNPSSGNPTSW